MSWPHFLHGDPELREGVEGVDPPDRDLHSFQLDIQPTWGTTLAAYARYVPGWRGELPWTGTYTPSSWTSSPPGAPHLLPTPGTSQDGEERYPGQGPTLLPAGHPAHLGHHTCCLRQVRPRREGRGPPDRDLHSFQLDIQPTWGTTFAAYARYVLGGRGEVPRRGSNTPPAGHPARLGHHTHLLPTPGTS
jgi:hypothetical protein